MRTRGVLFAAVLLLCAVNAFSQDPLKVAPESYKLQFENEWVKVTRVHYGPRAKVPLHEHTRWPAAYVYLNDSGPISFRHADWEHPVLTRPATKAGSFRISPTTAVNETHEVENPSDTPSDFLRVEFKTRAVNRNSLRGRFYRGPYTPGRNFQKVEFEHEQIRVTRLVCAPRKSLAVATAMSKPALLIALSPARMKLAGAEEMTLETGQQIWMAAGGRRRLENLDDAPLELLRFDFKTGPSSSAGR